MKEQNSVTMWLYIKIKVHYENCFHETIFFFLIPTMKTPLLLKFGIIQPAGAQVKNDGNILHQNVQALEVNQLMFSHVKLFLKK